MFATTELFLAKAPKLQVVQEVTPGDHGYFMFNDGGVEVEVAEFLYAFIHLIKAHRVLETGTHQGISASFMAQAMKELERGNVTTLEVIPEHFRDSNQLFGSLELTPHITSLFQDSRQYLPGLGTSLDFLFLDSEPQYRFEEFERFWPYVRENGYIAIHDLGENLGFHDSLYEVSPTEKVYSWPYGDFKVRLGPYIQRHDVQLITFQTPRQMVLFQKTAHASEARKLLVG
jgi:hypothetical protein